ncbi:hypothetical protein MNQ98_15205 [Paenibacillus sp. N3/727]|uniref:hypothetical protein n=1 Tax=Paenibacillus sp. N3/727 TaxID=2925845 RepID=UPI001F52B7CC|nr:hypothetical protein [Paenibacillus sp. N3/727]UNK15906.1 hypothetical protein MNQ98_15205 [Paenibacillus sp. N3/727]
MAEEYSIDLQEAFIGGDSAGAQIAGEFINLQINQSVQELLNIQPILKSHQIKGFISFSGLLNLNEFDETDSLSKQRGLILKTGIGKNPLVSK